MINIKNRLVELGVKESDITMQDCCIKFNSFTLSYANNKEYISVRHCYKSEYNKELSSLIYFVVEFLDELDLSIFNKYISQSINLNS